MTDFQTFNNFVNTVTYLYIRINGSLKWKHSLYPEATLFFKIEFKPCKLTSFAPGDIDQRSIKIVVPDNETHLTVPLPSVLREEYVSFEDFIYGPEGCTVDSSPLQVIYTPLVHGGARTI